MIELPEFKDYYHGIITRDEAESRLKHESVDGSFLVRLRLSNNGTVSYVLSVYFDEDHMAHFNITVKNRSFEFGNRLFSTFKCILYRYYQNELYDLRNLRSPVAPREPVQEYYKEKVHAVDNFFFSNDELSCKPGDRFYRINYDPYWSFVVSMTERRYGYLPTKVLQMDFPEQIARLCYFHPHYVSEELLKELTQRGFYSYLVRPQTTDPIRFTLLLYANAKHICKFKFTMIDEDTGEIEVEDMKRRFASVDQFVHFVEQEINACLQLLQQQPDGCRPFLCKHASHLDSSANHVPHSDKKIALKPLQYTKRVSTDLVAASPKLLNTPLNGYTAPPMAPQVEIHGELFIREWRVRTANNEGGSGGGRQHKTKWHEAYGKLDRSNGVLSICTKTGKHANNYLLESCRFIPIDSSLYDRSHCFGLLLNTLSAGEQKYDRCVICVGNVRSLQGPLTFKNILCDAGKKATMPITAESLIAGQNCFGSSKKQSDGGCLLASDAAIDLPTESYAARGFIDSSAEAGACNNNNNVYPASVGNSNGGFFFSPTCSFATSLCQQVSQPFADSHLADENYPIVVPASASSGPSVKSQQQQQSSSASTSSLNQPGAGASSGQPAQSAGVLTPSGQWISQEVLKEAAFLRWIRAVRRYCGNTHWEAQLDEDLALKRQQLRFVRTIEIELPNCKRTPPAVEMAHYVIKLDGEEIAKAYEHKCAASLMLKFDKFPRGFKQLEFFYCTGKSSKKASGPFKMIELNQCFTSCRDTTGKLSSEALSRVGEVIQFALPSEHLQNQVARVTYSELPVLPFKSYRPLLECFVEHLNTELVPAFDWFYPQIRSEDKGREFLDSLLLVAAQQRLSMRLIVAALNRTLQIQASSQQHQRTNSGGSSTSNGQQPSQAPPIHVYQVYRGNYLSTKLLELYANETCASWKANCFHDCIERALAQSAADAHALHQAAQQDRSSHSRKKTSAATHSSSMNEEYSSLSSSDGGGCQIGNSSSGSAERSASSLSGLLGLAMEDTTLGHVSPPVLVRPVCQLSFDPDLANLAFGGLCDQACKFPLQLRWIFNELLNENRDKLARQEDLENEICQLITLRILSPYVSQIPDPNSDQLQNKKLVEISKLLVNCAGKQPYPVNAAPDDVETQLKMRYRTDIKERFFALVLAQLNEQEQFELDWRIRQHESRIACSHSISFHIACLVRNMMHFLAPGPDSTAQQQQSNGLAECASSASSYSNRPSTPKLDAVLLALKNETAELLARMDSTAAPCS